MYEQIYAAVKSIDDLVWGWGMIVLLLGTHIFMTIRTKGIQRRVFQGIRLSIRKRSGCGRRSQSVCSAYNGACGNNRDRKYYRCRNCNRTWRTGSGSLVLAYGVFGIATKYSESLISVKYRVKTRDGRMQGGAMYALERGLHMKWLGILFAVLGGIASFGIGCATQVNAIASVCSENLKIPNWFVGSIVALMVGLVIFGGIKSIANVCEKLVPFMAIFYVIGCVIILIFNYDFIIPALGTICSLAFKPGAAVGGLIGGGIMQALHYGVARGLFSNESGLGSAPIAAAAAQSRNPVRTALISSTGTFWDTVVVCAMTGLVLVTSIMKNPAIDVATVRDGGVLTTLAFNQIPYVGPAILVLGIISFAFSTVLGWAYYGERCVEYFAGKWALIPYRVLYITVAFIAPIASLNLVWLIADILNALMAIPNLVAVLLLSPVIVAETKKYLDNIDAKDETPVPYEDEK